MSVPLPVVIDTDAGIDDVVALALAARSPELRIIGVTATYGNAELAVTAGNVRRVLALADRTDIPVLAGASKPLRRLWTGASAMHGLRGVGYAEVDEAQPVEANPAALFELLSSIDHPVTLVTLGPLTNLAHALAADATLVRARIERHLAVFGSVRVPATGDRWADFNAWSDPEAAAAVIGARLETVMIPLDATRRVPIPSDVVRRVSRAQNALTAWLGAALRYYVEAHERRDGLDGCFVHDAIPIAELLAPGLLTLAQLSISVDLADDEHRGRTREDPLGFPATVALDVDGDRVRQVLGRVLAPDG